MSIHTFSARTAAYIAREIHVDRKNENRMAFGLELLLGAVMKLLCLAVLAYYLGIFPETLTVAVTAGILRLASGGEHCSEYYRCLIGGTVCFLLLGWGSWYLNQLISYPNNILILLSLFPPVMAALWRYAPGDTENKPITEASDKARFKRWSLLIAAVLFSTAISFLLLGGILYPYSLSIAAGIIEQTFTITPMGYRFISNIDHLLSTVAGTGSKCVKG